MLPGQATGARIGVMRRIIIVAATTAGVTLAAWAAAAAAWAEDILMHFHA